MKVCLLGYGKMGKEIEKICIDRNHVISLTIDKENLHEFTPVNLAGIDVVIDFSTPASAVKNILTCFESNIPVVCGTTGWHDQLEYIRDLCNKKNQALFTSSNFSPGVNILFAVNEHLAGIMNRFPEYEVSIEESHHAQKLDAPSGTAINLAEQILSRLKRKKSWKKGFRGEKEELMINSIREGEITGIHEISYETDIEILQLKHSAKNRKGFAIGAVLAAEYIIDKKGVYSMRDLLGL